ncbi:hypothetical protein [Neptuniibacter sp.]|uniref:hypothetical protein n=1 Tax=Neptuniibacter sp. TaxID=1962643 RepID=UPI00261679D3|nr:hypothetical protein [Neptuniibacter sp.]MCP4597926.1 hypothetical protein [Neptuniibacter sp.]
MKDIITGQTTATGAAMNIEVGFIPARVDVVVGESTLSGFWDDSMWEGTFAMEQSGFMVDNAGVLGSHLPLIGTTDTQLGSRRCAGIFVDAQTTQITIPAVAAGTAFTATTHDVTAGKWGLFLLSVDADGTTFTITPSASLAYDTEALAIAALPAVPTDDAAMGVVTVEATSGAIFNATTDGLAGGSSGTPAETTNYYPGYCIMAGGISKYGDTTGDSYEGFTIGTHGSLNIAGSQIFWKAYRS